MYLNPHLNNIHKIISKEIIKINNNTSFSSNIYIYISKYNIQFYTALSLQYLHLFSQNQDERLSATRQATRLQFTFRQPEESIEKSTVLLLRCLEAIEFSLVRERVRAKFEDHIPKRQRAEQPSEPDHESCEQSDNKHAAGSFAVDHAEQQQQ